ncbi:MAG: tripartite tricarboxylate transporter substrate binding protein [Alphaproteobacteria bacterium]|nr:tripartite tricarboxylate transporter substrate binding protein [Alphaproteobacteria bacterium]
MNFLVKSAVTLLTAGAVLNGAPALAQDYPTRDITFVVPYNPGGATDPISRQFSSQLEKVLHVGVNVENKPGGSGTIGAGQIMRSKPDGYTIGLSDIGALAYQPLINKGLVYKNSDDYQPIVKLSEQPVVLVVRADARWKNFDEFVAEVKSSPGKIRVGVNGLRTAPDLVIQQFNKVAGTRIVTVPFSGGGGEATIAVLGGRIEAMANSGAGNIGHVKAGTLRALAVFTKGKYEPFPDASPVGDAGYNATMGSAFYVIGPKGMPPAVLTKLSNAALQVAQSEEFRAFAKANVYVAEPKGPSEMKADIDQFSQIYTELLKFIDQR